MKRGVARGRFGRIDIVPLVPTSSGAFPMRPPRRSLTLTFLAGAVALAAGACSGASAAPGWTFPPSATNSASGAPVAAVGAATAPASAAPAATSGASAAPTAAPTLAPAAQPSAPVSLNMTILSDRMTGKAGWPVFVPSDFTLPANSTVIVTVTNFDGATALPKGSQLYAKASGIVGGTFTVTPIKAGAPNGSAGPTATRSAMDPMRVSHTFTILALGINVPLAPDARTTFMLHTGAPGTYAWRCMDPCGTGPYGWGGPMAATSGYMQGTLTIS